MMHLLLVCLLCFGKTPNTTCQSVVKVSRKLPSKGPTNVSNEEESQVSFNNVFVCSLSFLTNIRFSNLSLAFFCIIYLPVFCFICLTTDALLRENYNKINIIQRTNVYFSPKLRNLNKSCLCLISGIIK